ncbi:MAG: response regulator [Luteolibacter sp.]
MRLLIIEDEAPMRTALVETLAAEGYRVQSAADGVTGLEMACTATYDLILLDDKKLFLAQSRRAAEFFSSLQRSMLGVRRSMFTLLPVSLRDLPASAFRFKNHPSSSRSFATLASLR